MATDSRKKWLCLACSPILLIALVILFLIVKDFVVHSIRLMSFDTAFSSLSHPQNTYPIIRYSRTGVVMGNGNHTDYWICEIRSYSGDFNNINNHYKKYKVKNPFDSKVEPIIEILSNTNNNNLPYDIINSNEYKEILKSNPFIYSVSVFSQERAGWDPRSH